MSDYNIEHYSIPELLDIFNITIPSKNNITNKIDIYNRKIKDKKELEFIHKAKQKLLHWINNPIINSDSHSLMINREPNSAIKTKEVSDIQDPTLLNPVYRNILIRTVNIDSGFRSNTLPKSDENRTNYFSKNLKSLQKQNSNNCQLNINSSTNFVALFSDRLNNILSIQLINYTIPYTWYNIDTQYFNNYFTYYSSITDLSGTLIKLDPGNYTLNNDYNIYDYINDTINRNNINREEDNKISFTYNALTSKTTIDIYKQYKNNNNFFYRYIWFDKKILNSKSNNTLGYKLGFRHFELIMKDDDIDTDISNNTPIIYLKLIPTTYTPLLQKPVFLKQTNIENNIIYNSSGKIYFTNNDIDLYMTDSSLQRFIIAYKKDPVYYLSDSDFSSSGYTPEYGTYAIANSNETCNQIVTKKCPSETYKNLRCVSSNSYKDCSVICDSTNVCNNLVNKSPISYDCTGERKHCSISLLSQSSRTGSGIIKPDDTCDKIYKDKCGPNPPSKFDTYICIHQSNPDSLTTCSSEIQPGQIYTYSCSGTPSCNKVPIPPRDVIYFINYFNKIPISETTNLIKLLSTTWKTISGDHLTPQNIIRTYPDCCFNITPYIHSSYTSDAIANLTLTKYLLLGIDDYQNNRINNGLVSIEPVESYTNVSKLDTTKLKVSNCEYSNDSNYTKKYTNKIKNELQTTTTAELTTINALEKNRVKINYKSRSPTIDIFAILKIP